MRTVGGAKTILVVIRFLVRRARVKRSVMALLKLYRVDTAVFGLLEEILGLLNATLMIVADLSDYITVGRLIDADSVDSERSVLFCQTRCPR